jgi:hypothetical protein
MLEASWRTADAVVAQKTRQTDPKDFGSGVLTGVKAAGRHAG